LIRGKRTHKIFLADGHGLFRRGLCTLLASEADMDVVGEASDWETALASAQLLAPDVIGMDCLLICEVPDAIKALRQLPQTMGVLLPLIQEQEVTC
jgi:DNA-binding NarL/FixJ family response regulator